MSAPDLAIPDNAICKAIFEKYIEQAIGELGVPLEFVDDEAVARRVVTLLTEAERQYFMHEVVVGMVNEIVAEDIIAGRVVIEIDADGDTCFRKVQA